MVSWLKAHRGIALMGGALSLALFFTAGLHFSSAAGKKREIAIFMYILIPFAGVGIGVVSALACDRMGPGLRDSISGYLEEKAGALVAASAVLFVLLFSTLAVLRYQTFHSSYFDLGAYEQKVWLIAETLQIPGNALEISLFRGHFQPILLLYAALYRIYLSPAVMLVPQVVTVAGGVIPLYFLSRDLLHSRAHALAVSLLYLLYPAVEFNSVFDFHPDHIYIPASLWAFYLAHRGRYFSSIIAIMIGCLAKETFFLGAAFFGFYLALAHRRRYVGILIFGASIAIFILYFLKGAPLQYQPAGEGEYNYLLHYVSLPEFLRSLLTNHIKKILFIYAALFPLLFLPLLRWKELMPALPLVAIQLLSISDNRYSPESQYTAGLIAPVFVAFVYALADARLARAGITTVTVLAVVFCVMLSANVGRSPSPISLSFSKRPWSDIWHYSNYLSGAHEGLLEDATAMIPGDSAVAVVAQNNVYRPGQARRERYSPYPLGLDKANYVLLDRSRPMMVIDRVDEDAYAWHLSRLIETGAFDRIFDEDGVMLFRRKMPAAGHGA